MKSLNDCANDPFGLVLWSIRAALCACPSAFFAAEAEFQHPLERWAMVVVVLIFGAGLAWMERSAAQHATLIRRQFIRAVGLAAWIKSGLVLLAGLIVGLNELRWLHHTGEWITLVVLPDALGGALSILAVSWLAGLERPEAMASLDSFSWTALTTGIQGMLMLIVIAVMALAIMGCVRVKERLVRVWLLRHSNL